MKSYTFEFEGKAYTLTAEKCQAIFNDENLPVEPVDIEDLLGILSPVFEENFEIEYYNEGCDSCPPVERKKKELVPFLESHFYWYTKDSKPVISTIQPEYEGLTYDRLFAEGKVDNSYVVSFVVCPACGEYQVYLDQVEM